MSFVDDVVSSEWRKKFLFYTFKSEVYNSIGTGKNDILSFTSCQLPDLVQERSEKDEKLL